MIDFTGFVAWAGGWQALAIACGMAWPIADALLGLYKVITGRVIPALKD